MTTTRSQPAIRATGLRKSFGDQLVLDGVDLEVVEGTVFALLGPNGAGKTTTVQILSTLIGADAGEVRVGGHDLARDPDAVRSALGLTGQLTTVDQLLTGEENRLLMADRVAVLDHGRLIAKGTPTSSSGGSPAAPCPPPVRRPGGAGGGGRRPRRRRPATTRPSPWQVPSDGDVRSLRGLLDRLGDASIEVAGLSVHLPDLDDVFLALTGQPDKDKEPAR